jgi:UDP-N-acetylglucosamine:LPS N-acetylglucosamine transferase
MTQVEPDNRPLILVTLGGGGWHRETYRILERYSPDEFRFAYVYGHHSGDHSTRRLPMPHPGERYPMHYLGPTRKHPLRFVSNTARFALSFFEAFHIVRRLQPDAIFALGHSGAIPLFAVAKLFRIKCVFVESLTRIVELSLAGRIVYHLRLAKRLYVQWAKLQDKYPQATFAGAVL